MTEVPKIYAVNSLESKLDNAVFDELEVTPLRNFRGHFKSVDFDEQARTRTINRSLKISRKDFRIMQSRPVSKPTRDNLRSGKLIVFAHNLPAQLRLPVGKSPDRTKALGHGSVGDVANDARGCAFSEGLLTGNL